MAFLQINNLCFQYAQSPKKAIQNVSFSVESGEYIALLGANGSGKSTLARLITGFLSATSGSITLTEQIQSPINTETESPQTPSGIVFQSPQDQFVTSIVQYDTAFGPENIGCSTAEITKRVDDMLNLIRLSEKANDKVQTLSGGQKQKLALAGILALHPNLLVLDEATSMLDVSDRAIFLTLLDEYNHLGKTIIHVTHDMSEALHAKRIIILHDGVLVHDKPSISIPEDTLLRTWQILAHKSTKVSDEQTVQEQSIKKTALHIKSLSFGYNSQLKPLLFNDISLAIEKGSITALVGNSGSGKSTLLELCAGILQPIYDTKDNVIYSTKQGIFSKTLPSLCVQDSEASLFEEFVADDIAYGILNEQKTKTDDTDLSREQSSTEELSTYELRMKVREAMELAALPFETFADRRTATLSGGEKRKCAIAGIIALNRPIMMFDEPTAGLDPVSRANILLVLKGLQKKGHTIIFSTHRNDEILIADRVITLKQGTVISDTNVSITNTESLPRMPPIRGIELLYSLQKAGQSPYHSARTPIHMIPAALKYSILFAFMICGIAFSSPVALLAVIVSGVLYALLARYPFIRILKNILKMSPWILLFFILQGIIFPHFALIRTLQVFLHFIALLIPLSVFMYTTDETQIVYGIEDFLSPLQILHIPVSHVALTVGIIFRWIPLLFEETAHIIKAQLLRGAELYTGTQFSLLKKVRAMLPLFIPLIIQTLRRAVSLGDAIQARYYTGKKCKRWKRH